jgi:AcrR family transcriptional regulator
VSPQSELVPTRTGIIPAVTEPTNPPVNASRRQQILDTAAAVFAEKGIASTTVRDISEQVGIYSGSLYHHFKSKEEIVAGILEPIVASQVAALERIMATTDDPVEILSRGVVAAVSQTAANPDAARILQQNGSQLGNYRGLDDLVRERRSLRVAVEKVIADGVANGHFRPDVDPQVAATVFFDGVLGAHRHLEPVGRHDVETLAQQLTAITVLGLRPHSS